MSEQPEVIVRIEDARACRYCLSGCRTWAAHHGISWSDFVDRGIPISVIEATGDELGRAVAAKARLRVGA